MKNTNNIESADNNNSNIIKLTFKNIEQNPHCNGVNDIEPTELALVLKNSEMSAKIQLIDVRQAEEFNGELGHIPKSKLIVLDTLPDQFDKIDKSKITVLICRSGGRSARAAAYLQSIGFENVLNMKGGMLLWNELSLNK